MGAKPQVTILEADRQRALALQAALEAAGLLVESPADPRKTIELHTGPTAHCYLQSARLFDTVSSGVRDPEMMPSVVVLMDEPSVPTAVRAMRAGALDVVVLPASHDDVVSAVKRALETDSDRRRRASLRFEAKRRLDSLSRRERQVLHHVLDGKSNKLMAEALGVSIKTIEAHRANLMRKSGCKSVAALVKLAILAGEGDAAEGFAGEGEASQSA